MFTQQDINQRYQNMQQALGLATSLKAEAEGTLLSYNVLKEQKNECVNNFNTAQNRIKELTIIKELFIKSASTSREVARKHFEKIVTDALQFVTQDTSIKFIIEESLIRGKPAYEFYVETLVDGKPCKQKPEDSCGGGFIDIISITLKYAYNQIFNDPHIMNDTILLDEPAKMVSEQMSIKAAEYIKFLDKHFNKQTIMITHNENLSSIADKYFFVQKDGTGKSSVSEMKSMNVNIDNLLKETGMEVQNG